MTDFLVGEEGIEPRQQVVSKEVSGVQEVRVGRDSGCARGDVFRRIYGKQKASGQKTRAK